MKAVVAFRVLSWARQKMENVVPFQSAIFCCLMLSLRKNLVCNFEVNCSSMMFGHPSLEATLRALPVKTEDIVPT